MPVWVREEGVGGRGLFSEAEGAGRGWSPWALEVLVARSWEESHFEKTILAAEWRRDRKQEGL